jgi:hypothetical protein
MMQMRNITIRTFRLETACLVMSLCAVPTSASAEAGAGAGEFKLTLGQYQLGAGGQGTDLNLRWRRDGRTLWLGNYRDGDFGAQWRAGWDEPLTLSADPLWPVQLLPSMQVASGGFLGGSLAIQAGAPFYAQFGIGRTNLKPYANLNFDPNDALTLALGWQGEGGRQLSVSVIADDRLGTGQQHHHLTLRWPLPNSLRLTADLLHKQGQGDAGAVNTWGWSLGLDGSEWFGRLARDLKQNFSNRDAWRLSLGRRF